MHIHAQSQQTELLTVAAAECNHIHPGPRLGFKCSKWIEENCAPPGGSHFSSITAAKRSPRELTRSSLNSKLSMNAS